MNGKSHYVVSSSFAAKKPGIDIDSLLDANHVVQSGYTMPKNVIVSEVDVNKANAEAKVKLIADFKKTAGFPSTAPAPAFAGNNS